MLLKYNLIPQFGNKNVTLFTGKIEEIGISMLEFLMKERRDVFALLYEEGDGRAKKIIQRLESIDNELDKDDIILVKCSDEGKVANIYKCNLTC